MTPFFLRAICIKCNKSYVVIVSRTDASHSMIHSKVILEIELIVVVVILIFPDFDIGEKP